jgi:hypothetical protein
MIPIAIGIIQGHNRNQINLFPVSLDESIDPDNEVRIIDLFVESLTVKDYGFRTDFVENGRPAITQLICLSSSYTGISIRYVHRGIWKKNADKTSS